MICLYPGERPLPGAENMTDMPLRAAGIPREETNMKIAVVCANGKAGKMIVHEALSRGLDVTAIARSENASEARSFVQKDLFDLTAKDLQGYDAVVDAFGAWTPETLGGIPRAVEHLCNCFPVRQPVCWW